MASWFLLLSWPLQESLAIVVYRFASRAVRRAPAWDCGYPGAGLVAQYSATSLAQPIRRVFGSVAFASHEQVEIPPPGDPRPARLRRGSSAILSGIFVYAPMAEACIGRGDLFNRLQFLTIRRYLSFVFIALVAAPRGARAMGAACMTATLAAANSGRCCWSWRLPRR